MHKIMGAFGAATLTLSTLALSYGVWVDEQIKEIEANIAARKELAEKKLQLLLHDLPSDEKKIKAIKNAIASPDQIGDEPPLSREEFAALIDNNFDVRFQEPAMALSRENKSVYFNVTVLPEDGDYSQVAESARASIRFALEKSKTPAEQAYGTWIFDPRP